MVDDIQEIDNWKVTEMKFQVMFATVGMMVGQPVCVPGTLARFVTHGKTMRDVRYC